jgi:hypothetical protein
MDYGGILKRAWQITWRWKVLWILGFLAALGSSMGGGSNFYSANQRDVGRWTNQALPSDLLAWGIGILVAVACLAFLVGIALWVVSVIARGGLIAGVQQVEDEGSTGFLSAWRVGRKRFRTLFGISALAAIPIILVVVIGAVLAILTTAGFVTVQNTTQDARALGGAAIVFGVVCGGALCCGLILLSVALSQIQLYAERAAILEGLNWIESFKRGWAVLKKNLGPTIIFWLIFLVIGLIFGAVIVGGVLALVVPLFAIFRNVEPGPWLVVPAVCGGLLAVAVGAVINSVVQTFTSATWTLVYRHLTGYVPPAVAESMPQV